MSRRFESREQLAGKIDWEGGVFAALDYGIRSDEMPEGDTELTEAWLALELAYDACRPLADRVADLLPDSWEGE